MYCGGKARRRTGHSRMGRAGDMAQMALSIVGVGEGLLFTFEPCAVLF